MAINKQFFFKYSLDKENHEQQSSVTEVYFQLIIIIIFKLNC